MLRVRLDLALTRDRSETKTSGRDASADNGPCLVGPCAEKMVLERMEDIQYTVVIRCVY